MEGKFSIADLLRQPFAVCCASWGLSIVSFFFLHEKHVEGIILDKGQGPTLLQMGQMSVPLAFDEFNLNLSTVQGFK